MHAFTSAGNGTRQVVVVERSPMLREHLAGLVRGTESGPVVETRAGAREALESMRRQPAGFVVFGLSLPDLDGIDFAHALAAERLAWRVLVLVQRDDEHTHTWLRRAPIDGWFDDASDEPGNLGVAVARVAAGGRYASPGRTMAHRGRATLGQLMTRHEQMVFSVIGGGADDAGAAERLGMAETTVHWHRQQIMRKLGLHARGELIRAAVDCGVVRFDRGTVLHPGFEEELRARARRLPRGAGKLAAAAG